MDRRVLLKLTASLVCFGFIGWFVTVLFSLQSSSVSSVVVTRTLVTAVLLVLATRRVVSRAVADRLDRTILGAAILSYVLFPPAWTGHALVGQLLVADGVPSGAVDLVLWTLLVVVASRTVEARQVDVRAPYQRFSV